MPRPNRFASAPDPLSNPLVGGANDMPSGIRRMIYAGEISSEFVVRGSTQYLFLDDRYELKVGKKVVVTYHSKPTLVGEFDINSDGTLGVQYVVPATLEPGLHTLHIHGETSEGELVDIYKSVYVAYSDDDWDGDGTVNNLELCGVLEPVNIDEDSDGIDDGCDEEIGAKPSPTKVVITYYPTTQNPAHKTNGIAQITTTNPVLGLINANEEMQTNNTEEQGLDYKPTNSSTFPYAPLFVFLISVIGGLYLLIKLTY